MTSVAVVGAAGYAGIETVRWVLAHPHLTLSVATSTADKGAPLASVYPALAGHTELAFTDPDPDAIAKAAEVAILAVPHTASLSLTPKLLALGVKVIDLSADFRLADAAVYEESYATPHTAPELLTEAVYGLPELDRSRLAGARLVACPGCYPTATILAAMPALEAGLLAGGRVIVDAKSGVSGAGRAAAAGTHFCTVNEALAPYKVAVHRHTSEIEQGLSTASGSPVSATFAPHLVPMTRGLLSTVYIQLNDALTTAAAHALYAQRYAEEPFVTVCEPGAMPSTADVRGTNRASVGVAVDERSSTLVAACAIDNLGKGAASQGIQCLNAVLGYPETTGLDMVGEVV